MKLKDAPKRFIARVTIGLALVLLGVGLHVGFSGGANRPNVYEAAQNLTVLIESVDGYGTGFIVRRRSPDGGSRAFIFTAKHVVDSPARRKGLLVEKYIRIEGFKFGRIRYPARVVYMSPNSDFAILEAPGLPTAFGSAEWDVRRHHVGDSVFHVGNFHGPDMDGTLSKGYISQIGVHPTSRMEGWNWALTDTVTAANAAGCSGGGVFNDNGTLMGMMVGNDHEQIFVVLPARVIAGDLKRDGWGFLLPGRGECPPDQILDILAKWADKDQVLTQPDCGHTL